MTTRRAAGLLTSLCILVCGATRAAAQVSVEWNDHPSIRAGMLKVDARVTVQAEGKRVDTGAGQQSDMVDMARRRVGIDGELGKWVAFQVERELAGDVRWRDVYLDLQRFSALRIRAGKFKLPFSLDENTAAANGDFAYRSMAASQLAPGRDIGVMVHGRLKRRILAYEAGVFRHDGDNAPARGGDEVAGEQVVAARVTTEPFARRKSVVTSMRFGAAWVGGSVPEGVSSIRGRTVLRSTFVPATFWVNGERQRLGAEFQWIPGPFSLKTEYMRTTQARHGQAIDGTDLAALITEGWYVSGTWAVTGGSKARGLARQGKPLFQGGIGSIELAGRFERLSFRSTGAGPASASPRADLVVPSADLAVTGGVNWYLNRWMKLQGNVIRDAVADPLRSMGNRRTFWSTVLRLQVAI